MTITLNKRMPIPIPIPIPIPFKMRMTIPLSFHSNSIPISIPFDQKQSYGTSKVPLPRSSNKPTVAFGLLAEPLTRLNLADEAPVHWDGHRI